MIAAAAATGTAAALLFVGAWIWASGPAIAALLFGTSNALGAVMLVAALSGLFSCAAFATALALDERTPGRGIAAPCFAVRLSAGARIRAAAPPGRCAAAPTHC